MSQLTNPGPIVESVRCSAICENGHRCKLKTLRSTLCWIHLQKLDHLRIKKSGLLRAGLGLYTTIPLVRGENITEYSGQILNDPPANWISNYALQTGKRPPRYIDAKKTNTAPGRFANSGGRLNNSQFVYDRRARIAHVRAVKSIASGSEIFVPYGRSFYLQ